MRGNGDGQMEQSMNEWVKLCVYAALSSVSVGRYGYCLSSCLVRYAVLCCADAVGAQRTIHLQAHLDEGRPVQIPGPSIGTDDEIQGMPPMRQIDRGEPTRAIRAPLRDRAHLAREQSPALYS